MSTTSLKCQERISDGITEALRKKNIDPKKFAEELKDSTARIRELKPMLWDAELPVQAAPELFNFPQGNWPVFPPGFPTIGAAAREILKHVSLTISPPEEPPNKHLQGGEFTWTTVVVKNTCGELLRNLVLWVKAKGPVTVIAANDSVIMNPQSLAVLHPGAEWSPRFMVMAQMVNDLIPAELDVQLQAEVCCLVSRMGPGVTFDVWPKD